MRQNKEENCDMEFFFRKYLLDSHPLAYDSSHFAWMKPSRLYSMKTN